MVVKAVTFGKVDLDWGSGAESYVAEFVGLAVVFLVAGLTAWIVL